MKRFLKTLLRIAGMPFVLADYMRFRLAMEGEQRFPLRIRDFYPQIRDKTFATDFDRHYVYHTSWAARILVATKPKKHVDISSSLYFAGIVSAFVPVDYYDYRPANLRLSDLTSSRADLNHLPFEDGSVASISCMHTVEHIGLGRYGDKIDPDGDKKAISELKRATAPGGSLLFVVPIGRENLIEFNAHRIYTRDAVLSLFDGFSCKDFSLIPEKAEDGGLVTNPSEELLAKQRYACGCFHFVKNA